jgi:light-regulated signal transduction histidine kinase (bacteriophytochrome)
MNTVEEVQTTSAEQSAGDGARIQAGAYLLELSPDWIVLRASENIHHLLGESHVTLIDEPLGRFVHAQALHDLRNLFSRLSGTTGIARAYAVRLTDDHDLSDIAFQLVDGRVLLEAVPSAGSFGESFGTVGGLVAGLASTSGQALLDGGVRRMRALTGFDRVTLVCGDRRAENSRGGLSGSAALNDAPAIVADTETESVAMFPRSTSLTSATKALMRSCDDEMASRLRAEGVCASLSVPFASGETTGAFRCDSRTPRAPSFELHAAAELFAQMFALQLEIDALRTPAQAGGQP